jgi:hypothetical protein
MLRLGHRRRQRGDRGAAAVEFAIVVIPLLTIILGILEYSLFLRDYLDASSMSRVAARAASTGADAGSAPCPTGVGADPDCRPGDMPNLAVGALAALQAAGSAVDDAQIQQFWVYKANDLGFPGTATTRAQMMADGCVPNAAADLRCVKYERVNDVLVATQAEWDYNSIDACIDDPDQVGVYLEIGHEALTGFPFPGIGDIQETTLMTFEPLSPETCRPFTR